MNDQKSHASDTKSLSWLLSIWREDLVANKGHWDRAGFHALAVYRLGIWAEEQRRLLGMAANLLYKLLYGLVRNIYSIELSRGAKVGRRVWIPHPAGIVISHRAEIGDDCIIAQNVTLGLGGHRGRKRHGPHAPKVGNGVEIGAGAVLIGGISIGDGARIGPNAFVMTDVPRGGTAFVAPAKVVKPLGKTKSEDEQSGPQTKATL